LRLIAVAGTLALLAGTGTSPAAAAHDTDSTHNSADMRSRSFNNDWRFALVNSADTTDLSGAYADAPSPMYDDSAWRKLDVPHDWSIELPITNAPGAGTDASSGFAPGGLGWYRKTFTLPKSMTGKRISLEFDGVYEDSVIYVNGQQVGNHPYGYTGFAVDLTPAVTTDDRTKNLVAVKVQNKLPGTRWYSGSGIERNVHLVVTDPIHVARHGTFVTTPDLQNTFPSGNYANVNVKTTVHNESGTPRTVGVRNRIKDASGAVVASSSSSVSVAGGPQTDDRTLRLDHPRLWSPDSPYRYTLETDLIVAGKVVDSTSTRFGVRWLRFDPDNGFFLNGQRLKIHGVDLHHDAGALGDAVNRDAYLRQMTLMKDMGANFLRTAHNPPAPELLEICDELGILVMDEAFDTWDAHKTPNDYARFFATNSDSDIAEMVNSAKNDPAVIMWSLGNEVQNSTTPTGVANGQRLAADVRAIDTTRPVVVGSDQYRNNVPAPGTSGAQSVELLDGVGMNYTTAAQLDRMHAAFPTKLFFGSETAIASSTRGVYLDPDSVNTGDDQTPGQAGSSNYQNSNPNFGSSVAYDLKVFRDRPYLLGQSIWAGMDYLGEAGGQAGGFPTHSNNWGLVDTAGFPKDIYYLVQSQWTSKPMVHLLPTDWTNWKPGQNVQVWTYSNVNTVELFLNGRSLGVRRYDTKTGPDGTKYLETTECTGDDRTVTGGACPGSYQSPNGSSGKLQLTWNVPVEPGKLMAVARQDGVEVARDEVDTAGPADQLSIASESKVITADPHALAYVPVKVVDRNGVVVPAASNLINVKVTGAGRLVGVDNGKNHDNESYQAPFIHAFDGLALAIVRADGSGGPITVSVDSPGMLPASTTLYSSNSSGSRDLGVDPVFIRAALGQPPALPATVNLVAADGTSRARPVRWDKPPACATATTGRYEIRGNVAGSPLPAIATVAVYDISAVATSSTVTATGKAPLLPATVRVLYTDGVERNRPVTWAPIAPAQYATAGTFTVQGTIDGVHRNAQATVRVTDAVTRDQNIARSTSVTQPVAGASFSGSTATIPAAMLDGQTTTGGWSNGFSRGATLNLPAVSRAHPSDWVTVSWFQPQHFNKLVGYFTTSPTRSLPASVTVTYWSGTDWVPANNAAVTWATTSNEPSTITFDPVVTTKIKLDLVSQFPGASNGHIQIAELQVIGDEIAASNNAALSDLEVNGASVPGFDPATTSYTVTSAVSPAVITATAADNGTVAIQQPPSLRGTATITVTSENGTTTQTYSVSIAVRHARPCR
jgi:beta-galactosidase